MTESFSPRTARAWALTRLACLILWGAGRAWSGEGAGATGGSDKFALWTKGAQLRGANVYQTRVIKKIYADSLGPGPYGPPFEQSDFDALSKAGANLVVLSHPGLFREKPPYDLDTDAEKNLDRLIGLAQKADLFVVITFRTGPGRSEYAILRDGAGDWFDKSYINDDIWKDARAQKAFAAMWKHTAQRYRGSPVVVGYNLMVEPNPDHVLDLEAGTFYPKYAHTTYDWNTLSARLTKAVREVDGDTPILVGGIGYSGVAGLASLTPTGDKRTVYDFHQYEPQEQYTHQRPGADGALKNAYPGKMDLDADGEMRTVDKSWLNDLLLKVEDFRRVRAAPVAATEFGAFRTEPGADAFLDDEMDLFESKGINYAVWEWNTSYLPDRDLIASYNEFNYRFGPDPASEAETDSTLMAVLKKHWAKNRSRPSNFRPLESQAAAAPSPGTGGVAPAVAAALARGINFDHIFEPYRDPKDGWEEDDWKRVEGALQEDEFRQVAELGFTHIRLNIGQVFLQESGPGFKLRARSLALLDRALDALAKHKLGVVLDLHQTPVPDLAGSERQRAAFRELWRALAARYAGRRQVIVFELLNEPRVEDSEKWREIVRDVVAVIRAKDPERAVVLSGGGWGGPEDLLQLGSLKIPNAVYTFHFYEPMPFTHQGASWGEDKGLARLRGIRWPLDPKQIAADDGLWEGWENGGGKNELAHRLAPVFDFARREGLTLYCGEFGVHKPYAPPADRARWIGDVAALLASRGAGWSLWAYHAGFDLIDKNGRADPAVVSALGLKAAR